MSTATKIPTSICPACGAFDPETNFVDAPMRCPATGYQQGAGYRCEACGEISEGEDWDKLAGQICCECGMVGTRNCVCPHDPAYDEYMRRRKPVLPELPAGFKFITVIQKEVA